MSETIAQAKRRVAASGGLGAGETLADALDRLPPAEDAREQSRMASMFAGRFDCHECRCHLAPPCSGCVDCVTCNAEVTP